MPIALTRVEDGAVLCLWRFEVGDKPVKEHLLCEYRGQNSRVVARWKGEVSGHIRLFRSRRATWMTIGGDKIYRVQNGVVRLVYSVKPGQMRNGYPLDSPDANNALEVVEDARGHTLFWSNEFSGGYNDLSLRGLLEFDGKTWTHHAHLPGVADKPFTAFVPRDARTFWLAVGDVGLFELDETTWTGQRIADPIPHAFEGVQKIQRIGNDWFLLADAPEKRYPDGDSSLRQSDLWRLRAPANQVAQQVPLEVNSKGANARTKVVAQSRKERKTRNDNRAGIVSSSHRAPAARNRNFQSASRSASSGTSSSPRFERVLRGLDRGGEFSARVERPVLATKQGLWLGALSGGAWWLPFNGAPVHLDWRRGLTLPDVSTLIVQRDGRLLASAWSGSVPDLCAYLAIAPVQAPQTFTAYGFLVEDARHHLWRVPNLSARVVEEWDGARWQAFPVPAAYRLSQLYYLSVDARARLWLLPDSRDGAVALFNTKTHSWQMFPSFAAALQTQLETLGPREFARLGIGNGKYLVPRFFPPNRIAFRGASEKLFFFDGARWHHWTLSDITRDKTISADAWEETPYFDASGVLKVNISDKTWSWHPPAWQSRDGQPHPFAATPTPTPPPGCGIENPESVVRDSSGALWMTKNRELWKAAFGLCALQFAPGERHPLRDGRVLQNVDLDARGNALLSVGADWDFEALWLSHPAPDTKLSVKPRSADSFSLCFASSNPKQARGWFRWRLDDGSWSAPQREPALQLEFVPSGPHRFEVAALDARLSLDPTPAKVQLRVALSPQAQLTKFLSMLRSPDYATREAGVRAFARQPARATPFLQAARRSANAELKWWIDAALEEMESQPKAPGT